LINKEFEQGLVEYCENNAKVFLGSSNKNVGDKGEEELKKLQKILKLTSLKLTAISY
jgi:hypothetical protein